MNASSSNNLFASRTAQGARGPREDHNCSPSDDYEATDGPGIYDGSALLKHVWPHTDISGIFPVGGVAPRELGDGSLRIDREGRYFDGRERPSATSKIASRVDCGAYALWASIEPSEGFFKDPSTAIDRLDQCCAATGVALATHAVIDRENGVTAYWCVDSYISPPKWRRAHWALFDLLFRAGLISYELADTWEVDLGRQLLMPASLAEVHMVGGPWLVRADPSLKADRLLAQLATYSKRSWPKLGLARVQTPQSKSHTHCG